MTSGKEAPQNSFQITAPAITMPKGGGAIRGMGEKFAANPVTGTGSMTIPIATSPGRSGFGPQLSLSYDSGAGNGPFGLGWHLSLPSITRKTDKGLPKYEDAAESDVFILSGAEDLVPVLIQNAGGQWVPEVIPPRTVDGVTYRIKRYRPRIEGLFARIESWTNQADPKDTFWRSISKDNITTWYGKSDNSRIADPSDKSRVFSWLICQSYDDTGNAIVYEYNSEDSQRIFEDQLGQFVARAHERNRTNDTRTANRYLKRISYGNREPYLPKLEPGKAWPKPPSSGLSGGKPNWYFEAVFDYGDGHYVEDAPGGDGRVFARPVYTPPITAQWPVRPDPFSTYRAGFELRTYRLCRRVLMLHHFPDELGTPDCLVRSTDFSYSSQNNPSDARNPIYTFIESVTQSGYVRHASGAYLKKSLPPVEFEYTQPIVQDLVEEIDAESLENLPIGLDGSAYQWTDLHGEGIPGILTEQVGAWFYKRNLSPITVTRTNGMSHTQAKFAPVKLVATKPNLALGSGAQIMDLAGDGQPDLVMLDGPMPGLYEHDEEEGWEPFRPFTARLNRDTRDPNLKFVDLDGDGHADVLITEDDAFIWHHSLAEEGFGPARRVAQALDEEKGPRIVFADGTQAIYLADLSGDGLTDLVRIRNGEVCYWPNLGYGRFGAKVTMDGSPWFDCPDLFDHKRLRLADIDGSGTTDIIYLHGDGIRLYFNQSGNGWSVPHELRVCPRVDDVVSIMSVDLLGNGTACLVWSSPLPGDARRPMRYVNLMGGQKPHLLVKTKNNLGAETTVQYAPSTKFYLQDKRDGNPWITKLPFPVHVVEQVTVTDAWRKTSFSSTYSYHHGYFDGIEREFRGFGRVEQIDVESYGTFEEKNTKSPYITADKTLYQPPVKTITWFHTGAFLDRDRILSHFEEEYFPHWLARKHPGLTISAQENLLPQPDLRAEDLNAEEWREALRACKCMMLRQEVVELEVHALEQPDHPEQVPVKLFSTAYHNCHIRRLQPKAINQHAVFLVAESEAVTYQYELDIRKERIAALNPGQSLEVDPRIAHTLNLQYDDHANVLQSVAIVYPRVGKFEDDANLADGLTDALSLIRQVQKEETHLAYSESRYTEDFGTKPADLIAAMDNHRSRLPCEVLTYELTGINPQSGLHFTLKELREFQLSLVHQASGLFVKDIGYHESPDRATPPKVEKRLVEHTRTLFFDENLVDPLPFKEHGRLGLIYEAYKLALTDVLLDAVFKDATGNKLDRAIDGTKTARDTLQDASISGYLSGVKLVARFAPITAAELAGQYWIRSGIAGFGVDAARHFYLPERYTDPFDNTITLAYDPLDLFVMSSTDMLGNKTEVTHFDFRVLAPREMKDINDNLSEVFFDGLGLPTAMAVKGKGTEGDNLIGFDDTLTPPTRDQVIAFFAPEQLYDDGQAQIWLGNATARHVYYFGEVVEKLPAGDTQIRWGQHPACASGIVRERHVSQLAPNEKSPLQVSFEYSDGMGSVVVKKVQAEPEQPGKPMRWIANGKTILNNKGKPVKQYEPYFSVDALGHPNHRYEEPKEEGVTPIIYYDAAGRTVRKDMPDGSFSQVEFSPWHVSTSDANDTVRESIWYTDRNPPNPDQPLPRDLVTGELSVTPEQRAAWLAAQHANTPALTILDSLCRDVISVAHNRVIDAASLRKDEKYLTFTKLDAAGKPLWIRDARKNLVMQYIAPPVPNNQSNDPTAGFVPCYDIAGNLLFQHSMDAGDRWMLNDAAGKPMLGWNSRGHLLRTDYDALHRPVGSFVKGGDPLDANRIIQSEKIIYGDTPGNGLTDAQKIQLNLRGKPYQHHDTAGIVTSMGRNPATGKDEAFDFKGNPLRSTRQLLKDYKATPDWWQSPTLEAEIFTSHTSYDALNRPIQLVAPHSSQGGAKLNVIRPGYNEANLLERVDVWLGQNAEPTDLLNPTTANLKAVTNIDYNAKGQRIRIEYNEANHPVITDYTYDPNTFRLIHMLTIRPKHPEGDKRTLQDLSYTYDPVGNITAIRDAAQQTVFFNNTLIEPSNVYTYDALYRLIHAEGREHAAQNNLQRDAKNFDPIIGIPFPNSPEALQRYTEYYEYDPVGNILALHHATSGAERWVRWYQYALDSNQLLATRLPSDTMQLSFYAANPGGYAGKYTYDPHGNMTAMLHLPVMEWDFKDQLRASQQQVIFNGGTGEKTYYVYDGAGQRVRKVTERPNSTRKKERTYLGGFEVYRAYDGSGTSVGLERETLHVMDDKQRIALVEMKTLDDSSPLAPHPSLVRYQLGNHLGSATLELDDQAKVISHEEFHPFGTTAYEAARNRTDAPKRYRYTGKERDEETGLSYHGARYYAPWLGRWVSCDPEGTIDGLNLHQYTSNNPTIHVDPTGTQQKAVCSIDPEHPSSVICNPVPETSAEQPVEEVVIHGPKRGSKERQAELDAMKPKSEDEPAESTAGKVFDVVTDFIPVVGGAKDIYSGVKEGKGWKVALGIGSIVFDVATLGGGSLIKGGIKTGIKQGAKALAREGAELAAKELAAKAVQEAAEKLAQEAAEKVAKEATAKAAQEAAESVAKEAVGKVALDANALIRGLEKGELAALDAAIAGRVPTISITAAKEFLKKGDVAILRSFLAERGGYIGKAATEAEIQALKNEATLIGRVLRAKDAAVAGSAIKESAVIITRDEKLIRFLNAVGIPASRF